MTLHSYIRQHEGSRLIDLMQVYPDAEDRVAAMWLRGIVCVIPHVLTGRVYSSPFLLEHDIMEIQA